VSKTVRARVIPYGAAPKTEEIFEDRQAPLTLDVTQVTPEGITNKV
jgi:hypothetical protein